MKIKSILAAMAVIISVSANRVMASNYPGDYSIKRSCQNRGPVSVCRALQTGSNLAVLDIYYNGYLKDSQGLSVWVKVNYRDGSRSLNIPMIINSQGSARITGGCLVGRSGGCEVYGNGRSYGSYHFYFPQQ